jgi:hypothetical protein
MKFMAAQIALAAIALVGCVAAEEYPFVDDLPTAIQSAKGTGKLIILYTGRSAFCEPKTPQECFREVVLKRYPELKSLAARSILVDGFIYTPMNDAKGRMTDAFRKDLAAWTPMADKYGIRYFYPAITILTSNGEKDLGPIFFFGGDFSMTGDKDDLKLAEYLKRPAEAGTGQPATRPESKSEGSSKPQPESEGRSR